MTDEPRKLIPVEKGLRGLLVSQATREHERTTADAHTQLRVWNGSWRKIVRRMPWRTIGQAI